MKIKHLTAVICVLLNITIASAQSKVRATKGVSRPLFHSFNTAGLLEGEAGSAFSLQTVNGFSYKNWFAGAGAGLDYYSVRSLPVFIDLRKELLKKRALYVYGDAGIHFLWRKKDERDMYGGDNDANGFYYDAGLGYRLPGSKRSAFILSAGFTGKQYTTNTEIAYPCLFGPCPVYKQQFDYSLLRLLFKAGWMF